MNYTSLIEFIRANKQTAIENMRTKLAVEFSRTVLDPKFDSEQELKMFRTSISGVEVANSIIELILEKLESGGN